MKLSREVAKNLYVTSWAPSELAVPEASRGEVAWANTSSSPDEFTPIFHGAFQHPDVFSPDQPSSTSAGPSVRPWELSGLDVAANPTRKDSEARLSETQREMIFEEARRAALDAVQQEAAEVRARARQEAEEIMRQALSSAEDARERARLEGMADAHRQTEDLVKMAGQLVKELTDWQARMFAQSESQVLGLVSDMAEKLFGCGFRLEESLLKNVYERALSEAKALGSLRLRANPSDITRLDELWPVQQMALRGQKIELVPDQDVLPGGCFIEGEYGSVDARVSTELRLMQDCLDETADSPESGEKAFATYDSTHRGSA